MVDKLTQADDRNPSRPDASKKVVATLDAVVVDDLLEDISIDGMCGVY